MSSTRKNHPASFKAKVVLEALHEDVPVSILALKNGIHVTVIHRWKKEAMASFETGFSGKYEKISNDQQSKVHEPRASLSHPAHKKIPLFIERARDHSP